MVFCNMLGTVLIGTSEKVTILILIDGFLQYKMKSKKEWSSNVTILILIDGFLQFNNLSEMTIRVKVTILILIDGFLQYFSKRLTN